VNEIDFTFDGGPQDACRLTAQLGLGLFGVLFIGISLAFEALEFFSQVAVGLGTALGFLFPALSTVFDFRGGTHAGGDQSIGQVHGMANLWIADASTMPDCIRANTNATTIMLGEREAEFLQLHLTRGSGMTYCQRIHIARCNA
jgi:hypothetical protein